MSAASADEKTARMLSALGAAGPPSGLEDLSWTFGQFVGSWDLEVSWFAPDGEVVDRAEGEWHFGWVLGGLAVQDVWIAPRARRDRPLLDEYGGRGDYGTSLRFFDETINAWRSTWIGPVRGLVRTFVAREVAGDVFLTDAFAGATTRWSFTEITPTSFTWRNEERASADQEWVLLQRFAAVRA